jgi:hypothetical protein
VCGKGGICVGGDYNGIENVRYWKCFIHVYKVPTVLAQDNSMAFQR